jgi:hypothetical protein
MLRSRAHARGVSKSAVAVTTSAPFWPSEVILVIQKTVMTSVVDIELKLP